MKHFAVVVLVLLSACASVENEDIADNETAAGGAAAVGERAGSDGGDSRETERPNEPVYSKRPVSASDYEHDLTAPARILNFKLADKRVFRNPFLGAHLRYQHVVVPAEAIDIFIYPIASHALDDRDGVLKREEARSREELGALKEEGKLTRVDLDKGQSLYWRDQGRIYTGRYFSGTLENRNHEVYHAADYFFIKKDKILKFRVSRSVLDGLPRVDDFVRQAVVALEPPGESPFMAKLRSENR